VNSLGEYCDTKVIALGEKIDHPVGEEEGGMFFMAKRAKLYTTLPCDEMLERRQEISAAIAQNIKVASAYLFYG
jgi:hypothetical protein